VRKQSALNDGLLSLMPQYEVDIKNILSLPKGLIATISDSFRIIPIFIKIIHGCVLIFAHEKK
jgi:hypothetical protein